METRTITMDVPEAAIPALRTRLDRLARRAVKAGIPVATMDVGSRRLAETDGPDGKVATYVVPVTVTAEVPDCNGWRPVATLHHLADGTVPMGAMCSIPDAYLTVESKCDHCQTNRFRRDTYLFRHATTGEFKQVGSTCFGEFFGGRPFAAVSTAADYLGELAGACEQAASMGGSWTPGHAKGVALLTFLMHAAAMVRLYGFLGKAKAYDEYRLSAATAELTLNQLAAKLAFESDPTCLGAQDYKHPELQDAVKAQSVIDWALSLELDESADSYLRDLQTIARVGSVDRRLAGLAASMVVAETNQKARAEREAAKARRAELDAKSTYFGTEGKREVFMLTVERLVEIGEPTDLYGVRTLVIFRDQAGNAAKWWTSNPDDSVFVEGATITVKGTVKGHEEYKGVKQTTLSRVAVYVEKARIARRASRKAQEAV